MVIYLDSCAIIKLLVPEPESPALTAWLNDRSDEPLVTSMLAEIEVPRALRRSAPRRLGVVTGVLARLDRFEIDAPVRATAAAYVEPALRSLDAIHLATADNLVASGKTVTAFVTYHERLAAVAADAGHAVVIPGAG
ncbi:MAG TPA: type II toxin-antitoxin system VapC family toxin [Pseudonocardiaceae bacterium]